MLRRKAWRDMKKNLSSFVTIFLMTCLGVLVFSGIHSYMDGMAHSADVYYEAYHLQDLWVAGENFTQEDLETIKGISGVENAERALVVHTELKNYEDVILEANFIESNEISRMYLVEGSAFDYERDGFWLDSYLAENLGIKVGDELTTAFREYEISGKVLGLVNTPDHVYSLKDESAIFPTHRDFGYVYLSMRMFPLDYYVFTNIYVETKEDADLEAIKREINKKVDSAVAVTGRDACASVEGYQSEVDEGSTYSGIFTMLFLFIAVLSVVTTMSRFVRKQRTQIGTMKALGISRAKIVRHYISFGFYVSLIASALGVVAGRYLIGMLFIRMEKEIFEMPEMKVLTKPVVYVVALLVVAMITGVTYLACRKVLKEPASEALRLEIPKVKAGEIRPSTGLAGKASVAVRWNLRDIRRNKGRTITGIVGIVGCTMLVVCALGMHNTMNFFLEWQFERLYQFEYKLDLEAGISAERLQELYEQYGDATSMSLAVEAEDAQGVKSTQRIIVNDATKLLRYTDDQAKPTDISDDGIYLPQKLLETLGLREGDEFRWSVYGDDKEYRTKIAGSFREPQGQSIAMTRAYAEKLGIAYQPDCLYTDAEVGKATSVDGVSLVQNVDSLKAGMSSMLELMNMLIALLIAVSVILAVVIIYNLGTLSFAEKQYQFATLKVLGFADQKIRTIYIMQNIWVTAAAILIGLPLGYGMTAAIFGMALGDNFDMLVYLNPLTYLVSTVGIFAVSYLINLLLGRKVKTIDMVTSLKANE